MSQLSVAIANEFLKQPGALGSVTQMQIQKLVYIAHGWSLALTGEPLVSDPVKAWDYGPVFPYLYDHTKFNGREPMKRLIHPSDDNPFIFFGEEEDTPYQCELNENQSRIIELVWSRYGKLGAYKLSDLTHKVGTPWHQVFYKLGKGGSISNEIIADHYKRLANAA
ncbi:MAG: type II toxin-antitoxin system antitoxin SocA domain-containing protein [Pseudomonadota bacterium]